MAEIRLEKIDKRYPNGFHAVKDLSLTIAESELLVLVGPSGCGKTTALRMIAGLEDITSGDVYIGGERMNDVLERDRDIAMVFQNYALYPHMTVAQNIAFSLKLSKVPKHEIRARVQETATLLGLEALLDRRPKQLSGGQRQRVAMGRAIIRKPRVFLMDEPLSNLDAQLRVQMRGEIESLQKRLGVTTVYVTHDQVEALTMGDRIAVLRDGELQQIGDPADVYDRPVNLFVAGFIGSPPMNLAHATVSTDARSVKLGSTTLPIPDEIVRDQKLAAWAGRPVILGIRPEDLHASSENGQPVLSVQVDRVESVGASLLTHFHVDARDAKTAALAAVTGSEVLEEAPLIHGEGGTSFCASFEPRSAVRVGDRVEVAVDTARLHFFDAESQTSTRAAQDC